MILSNKCYRKYNNSGQGNVRLTVKSKAPSSIPCYMKQFQASQCSSVVVLLQVFDGHSSNI